MEKMLGNQYFMAQKFAKAIPHLEKALHSDHNDLRTSKNLVVCYVTEKRLSEALPLLGKMLSLSPNSIFRDLLDTSGCPCIDVLIKWTRTIPEGLNRKDYLLSMGVLALFCNPELASTYFRNASTIDPGNDLIGKINQILVTKHESFSNELKYE